MKKFFKILSVIIIVLILVIIILPFAFKGQIIEKVKQEANNNLNAKVDFGDFGLSLFRSFPDFSLEVNDLTIVGVDKFQDDTLANIGSFFISIDLMSVFKGESYKINAIRIDNPKVLLMSLEDGAVNWDIVKSDGAEEDVSVEETDENSNFKVSLKKVTINRAQLQYYDDALKTYVDIYGLDHTLKGDLTADQTNLHTDTHIDDISLSYGGVKYLDHAVIGFNAGIDADLANSKYTLKKNELSLNNLFLAFDGYFKLLEEDYELDINFMASKTNFKNFLSLIPVIYAKDFEDIKTTGTLSFDGFVKGIYSENLLPAFQLNIGIDEGSFKYPDLPGSVENITLEAVADNPGGDTDNTVINIKKLHLEMSENPVDLYLLVKTPVSDPYIDGHIQGEIDLAKIKDVYPLSEGEDINGLLNANVFLKGNISSIENEEYQDFEALGSLLLREMKYKSSDLPNGVEIKNAQLNFSPSHLELVGFNSMFGKSDLSAEGKITNYLAYVFTDDLLEASFTTRSRYFNLNDLMAESNVEVPEDDTSEDTVPLSVIKVPANIEFYLSTSFDEVIYDKMEMKDVSGAVFIRDERALIDNLKMKLLDGEMTVNGRYNTSDPENPEVDFDLDIKNFDIQKSFNTFGILEKLAPITKHAYGTFSTTMKYYTVLDNEMMPVLSTMSGKGNLQTSSLEVKDVKALDKLASALKMDQLKELELDKVKISYEFVDGKVYVKPYDIKYKNISGVVSGTTSFDKEIDYDMKLSIPRSEFGSEANNVLDGLLGKAKEKGLELKMSDVVNVDVKIQGTVNDPTIKTGLKEVTKNATEQLKSKIEEELETKKKELENKAREEKDRLQKEAEEKIRQEKEKAAAEAMKLKKEAEEKAKKEAEALKKKAEEEAKKKLKKLF